MGETSPRSNHFVQDSKPKTGVTARPERSASVSRAIAIPHSLNMVLVAVVLLATMSGAPDAAYASDNLELVPDYGLFNLFGESYFGQLWVMVLTFVILIFPLNALLFKPIFHALDQRAERIQGARTRSTQLDSEADSVLDRYETAIREARAEAEGRRQSQLVEARSEQATLTTQARGEAEQELAGARTELARSLEEAQATLRAGAEDLAQAAAEQVLGRSLS